MNGALSVEELAEERLLERYGRTRSALGPGTVIQGKLTFDTTIRIDGNLSGDVFSSKAIIVAKSGFIDAKIDAAVLVVVGHVKGEIKVSDRLEIIGGGIVEGQVETPKLIIEPGAVLNGSCKMKGVKDSQRDKPQSQPEPIRATQERVEEPVAESTNLLAPVTESVSAVQLF